ncbi:hypothetical protein CBW56_01715 [Denitratisoma oestradiolicum]|nr:hypothetical protein CBW56_01715 [Denitratisoma oestradiolicum]
MGQLFLGEAHFSSLRITLKLKRVSSYAEVRVFPSRQLQSDADEGVQIFCSCQHPLNIKGVVDQSYFYPSLTWTRDDCLNIFTDRMGMIASMKPQS